MAYSRVGLVDQARGYVWDSTTLSWVAEVQAGGGSGSTIITISTGSLRVLQSTYSELNAQTLERPWSTTSRSSVTQSSTNVTLQAASTNRRAWSCFNNPTQSASLFMKYGVTASTADFDVKVLPQQLFEMPQPAYTGQIDGVWDSTGVGFARVLEGLN